MTSARSAADTGLPKIPTIPGWLNFGLYAAMALTLALSWLGVLAVCFGRIS